MTHVVTHTHAREVQIAKYIDDNTCASRLTSTPPTPLQTQEGGKKNLTRESVDGGMQGDRTQIQTDRESRVWRGEGMGQVLREEQIRGTRQRVRRSILLSGITADYI